MAINRHPFQTLSVIIPCLGHATELGMCLSSLQMQVSDASCEVVVVDSGWDERVVETASGFPLVKVVRSKEVLTPGAARNLGVQNAKGDWLAFLDADCVPESASWVQQARESLRAGYYICGGPVLDLFPNHPIAWADNHLQFADFQSGRRAGPGSYFPACNLLMPRKVFDELGGFVSEFLAGEDTLLSSLANSKFPEKMYFDPRLIVRHHGRRDWNGFLEHQRLLGYHRSHSRLHMNASYYRLVRHGTLAGLVILRRLGYISIRTLQYDPAGLIRLVLFFPWLMAGLIAWTTGFYKGYVAAESDF